MFRMFIAALVLATGASTALAATDFSACPQHFFKGYAPQPAQAKQLRALCFDGFAILHSGQTKTAVYAAQYMTPASLTAAKSVKRVDKFYEEARLPRAERSTLQDYVRSGWDRGHLVEAAASANDEIMAQSFSLSNMVPQNSVNNRGPWAKSVEAATRKYAQRSAGVYVVTGPIYDGAVTTIGPNAVWVPTQLFKLVYDPKKGRAWAYIVDNSAEGSVTRIYSYADLVSRLGYELLPAGTL